MKNTTKSAKKVLGFMLSLLVVYGCTQPAFTTPINSGSITASAETNENSVIKLQSVTTSGSTNAFVEVSFDNDYTDLTRVAEAGVFVNGKKLSYNSAYSYISYANTGDCIVSGNTIQFYTSSLSEGDNTVTFTVPDGDDISVGLHMSKSGDYWSGYSYTVRAASGEAGEVTEPAESTVIDFVSISADADNSGYTVAEFGNEYAELQKTASAGVYVNGTKLHFNSAYNSLYYVDKGDCIVSGHTIQFHSSLFDEGENTVTFTSPDGGEDKSICVKVSKVEVPPKYWYESVSYDYIIELADDEEQAEPQTEQQLFVRLNGSFDHRITGQEDDLDAVSSATTGGAAYYSSGSTAHFEYALADKDTAIEDITEEEWHKPDYFKNGGLLKVNGAASKIVISPECEGIHGEIDPLSGDVYLRGVPQQAGIYNVHVYLDTDKGSAESNPLEFKVYSGNEKLADRLTYENCTQTADGKYMYDCEPWYMQEFGGDNETVIVPKDIKAWYGSHAALPQVNYGEIGRTISLTDGEEPTQTLIIPTGCDLTMVNMRIHSGVKVIVEKGAKLTLRQTTAEGIIEVLDGGTFSMDYNDYSGEWLHGSSINGQLRMKDGSVLENARITCHANYTANDDINRQNSEPLVTAEGNVTIKGDVYILGEEAPTGGNAQAALSVSGTLTITEGSVLACYGGGTSFLTADGGDAVILDNGTVNGAGSLIAIGGYGMNITADTSKGNGGAAVSGKGIIAAAKVYLEGGASYHEPTEPVQGEVTLADTTDRILVTGKGETTEKSEYYWFGTGEPQTEKVLALIPKNSPAAAVRGKVTVTSVEHSEKFHQFRLNWNEVKGAQRYGVAVYLAGKWKIVTQDIPAGTTSYTSPKLRAGQTYKMVICAKVGGKWDISSLSSRAFTVTVK
ncbi:MAG: hypothetical protein E7493_02755 [Ruminococcus albus]|nr:hypothetical protein [Ruminococcus albus]